MSCCVKSFCVWFVLVLFLPVKSSFFSMSWPSLVSRRRHSQVGHPVFSDAEYLFYLLGAKVEAAVMDTAFTYRMIVDLDLTR